MEEDWGRKGLTLQSPSKENLSRPLGSPGAMVTYRPGVPLFTGWVCLSTATMIGHWLKDTCDMNASVKVWW